MTAAATSGYRSLFSARYRFSIHIKVLERDSAGIRIPVDQSWAAGRIAVQFAVGVEFLDHNHACFRPAHDESWPVCWVAMQPTVEPMLFTRDSPGSRHPIDPGRATFTMQPPVHTKFFKRHNSTCRIAQGYRRSFRWFAV